MSLHSYRSKPEVIGGDGHLSPVELGDRPKRVLLQWRTWATVPVVLFLGAFLAGWFTTEPGRMSRILARFGKMRSETIGTANDVESTPQRMLLRVFLALRCLTHFPTGMSQNLSPRVRLGTLLVARRWIG